MRQPPTGEPCAGEPPARFGGRGGFRPFPTPIQQEPCNESTLLLRDHRIFRVEHKDPAAPLTAMILFAGMDMAVSLKP